jgi:DNA-binding transcriptional regulator YiaG
MLDIKRDRQHPTRFILILGRQSWHISYKEAQHLYKRLKHYQVWDEDMSRISAKIREHREERRLTLKGLAFILGVSMMEVMRWENGKNEPSKLAMAKLVEKGVL